MNQNNQLPQTEQVNWGRKEKERAGVLEGIAGGRMEEDELLTALVS